MLRHTAIEDCGLNPEGVLLRYVWHTLTDSARFCAGVSPSMIFVSISQDKLEIRC